MAEWEYLYSTEVDDGLVAGTMSMWFCRSVSGINTKAKQGIPRFSTINESVLSVEVKRGGSSLSTSNTDLHIFLSNEEKEDPSVVKSLYKANSVISNSYKTFSVTNADIFNSNNANAGNITVAKFMYFNCKGTIIRHYWYRNVRVYWKFTPPTYKITVASGGGGTVSGGGTFDVTVADQTKRITATPNAGYKFVKWVDSKGNTYTNASLDVKISQNNISSHSTNVTYTAYFETDKINKIYIGTSQPKKIYVGTQEVKAVYIGTTKVYG